MTTCELMPKKMIDVRAAVHEYCAVDGLAYQYFDGLDPGSDPDDIEPADIWITNNLNAGIDLKHFAAIWGRAESARPRIRQALQAIPVDECLWTASAAELSTGGDLLDIMCGPQALRSRITKILHKKRPNLFPIIDTNVSSLFDSPGVVPLVDGRSWQQYMVELAKVVGPWISQNVSTLVTEAKRFPPLTPLRVYDICLWKYCTPILRQLEQLKKDYKSGKLNRGSYQAQRQALLDLITVP